MILTQIFSGFVYLYPTAVQYLKYWYKQRSAKQEVGWDMEKARVSEVVDRFIAKYVDGGGACIG